MAFFQISDHASVWVAEIKDEWYAAELLNRTDSTVTIMKSDRTQRVLQLNQCQVAPRNARHLEGIDDLIKLQHLDEPNVLHNIQLRFQNEHIYTYTGPILLAVNPWMQIPIYNREEMSRYKGKTLGELPPHIYGVADAAYRNMLREERDQAILVSGESGAGKTETTKFVMNFLVFASGARQEDMAIEAKILESNPLLEAFGNAKTLRNDNSSRFGKYIDMFFEKTGKISGAALQTYLLEKARVVNRADGETNFHIFYQLCHGWQDLDAAELGQLHLKDPSAFQFAAGKGQKSLDPRFVTNMFGRTIHAMDRIGINAAMRFDIFTVLAAILHLGNVEIKSEADGNASLDLGDSSFATTCQLLQCQPPAVQTALCSRSITARERGGTQVFNIAHSKVQATDGRDALAKALYSVLFSWLVQRVNLSLHQASDITFKAAVLDIFGFEVFEHNGFEQFCINYANEKLQQLFNKFVFKLEQEEYQREQIQWSYVDFKDNAECLELIEKPPMGILSILDEECIVPQGTDAGFVHKMRERLANHPYFAAPRIPQHVFCINHYAGQVAYDSRGFLVKNKDALQPGLVELIQSSGSVFLRMLFEDKAQTMEDVAANAQTTPSSGGRRAFGLRKSTIIFDSASAQFKQQLSALMATIERASPHFVRCINPNGEKRPKYFNTKDVLSQLRCGGVMDAVRVTRAGFPTRYLHHDFLVRYHCLAPSLSSSAGIDPRSAAANLLKSLNLDAAVYRLGISKVFFRHKVIDWLEQQRTERLRLHIIRLQRMMRGHLSRKLFLKKKAAVILSKFFARAVCRRRFALAWENIMKKREQERLAKLQQQAAQGDAAAAAAMNAEKEEQARQQQQQAAAAASLQRQASAVLQQTDTSNNNNNNNNNNNGSMLSPGKGYAGNPPSALEEWSIKHMRDSLAMERDTRFKTEKELGDMRIDFRVVEMEVERERELRKELVQLVWLSTSRDTTETRLQTILQDLKRRRQNTDRSIIRDHLNSCITLVEALLPRVSQQQRSASGYLSDDRRKIQLLESQLAEAQGKLRVLEQQHKDLNHNNNSSFQSNLMHSVSSPGETPLSPLKPRQMAELLKAVVEVENMKDATELQRRLSAAVSNLTALARIQANSDEVLAHRDSLRAGLRMLQDRMSNIISKESDRYSAKLSSESSSLEVRALQEKLFAAEDELKVREAHINALNAKLHASTAAAISSSSNYNINDNDKLVRREICALLNEIATLSDTPLLKARLDNLRSNRGRPGGWKGADFELDACLAIIHNKIQLLSEIQQNASNIHSNITINNNNIENNNSSSVNNNKSQPSYLSLRSSQPTLDPVDTDIPIDSDARALQVLLAIIRDTEGCLDVDLLRRRAARLRARLETQRPSLSPGERDLTREVLAACISVVERQQRLGRELQSLRKLASARRDNNPTSSSSSSSAMQDYLLSTSSFLPTSPPTSTSTILGLQLAPRDPSGVGSMVL